jgi:thymidylate synthase (FAD)
MLIVEPYAKMLGPRNTETIFDEHDGLHMLKRIEYYTRVSHRSEDSITEDSWRRLITASVMEHGDMSVIEHEKVTVEALVDRGITHEWVRHRIGSYTQESTRFVNYAKKGGEAKVVEPEFPNVDAANIWRDAMIDAETAYMRLLDKGCKPQIARSVFPTGLASKIIVTFNLRTWRHFFIMRTSAEAHPQMKQVTLPLLADFKRTIPILYDDIIPGERQAAMMRLLR